MSIANLIGKTITKITGGVGDDEIIFDCNDGTRWRMVYHPDCCASCEIEDIAGDLSDLIDSPIVDAREETNSDNPKVQEYADESFTWTFYIIQSRKGAVVIRWYGSSNGYYSETASFEAIK